MTERLESAPTAASPLTALPGIGPARAERLARLGLRSVRDLLLLIPSRLEPWEGLVDIAAARERLGGAAAVRGALVRFSFSRFGRRSLVRARIADASGEIDVLFFNQPWLRERLAKGVELEVYGRVVEARGRALAASRLAGPERPFPARGELLAAYPSADGLTSSFLRELCRAATREHATSLADPLDEATRAARGLVALGEAARELHFPTSTERFAAARRRVALEPLLALQARILARVRERRFGRARRVAAPQAFADDLFRRAGFAPTAGQRTALAAIRDDLAAPVPMRRLLQGDVGSGKTLVALCACLATARAGAQAAFLAPTEILAEQHFEGARAALEDCGVATALVTGSLPARVRTRELARLESGAVGVVFGTHSLLAERVRFAALALAVIDEQQRFGVEQRGRLLDKGRDVHALLLTATPIPRTLALALYGDLEVSLVRERPAGRGAVTTRWMRDKERARIPALLGERLAAGEQAFWVVPRIGAAGDEDETGAEQRFAALAKGRLAEFGIELVHAKVPREERARRLERFRRGASRLLVATTVIEVGVDVPAATAMVIEGAERLGLAQLHQLRGRVGRGPRDSVCWLVGAPAAAARFEFLEREGDGFAIAEEDLRARGMGDLAGVRQAGENAEGLADLENDLDLLLLARDLLGSRDDLFEHYSAGARAGGPA